VNYLRPYAGFASIQEEENVASSMYNGLQIGWNRRFANGLAFGFAYTLSKSLDNSSNYKDIVPDTLQQKQSLGPIGIRYPAVAVVNYVYTLPFFHDQTMLTGKLLGGWQISGVNQFQTGVPCDIGTNNDYAGDEIRNGPSAAGAT